jgi:hypothetical protein
MLRGGLVFASTGIGTEVVAAKADGYMDIYQGEMFAQVEDECV